MTRMPATATPLQRRAPLRGALAWLLMLAVLFGQGLGAVHSISHGAPGAGPHAHTHPQGAAHARAGVLDAHGPACDHSEAPQLQALFGHAPDEPGCRLYDQLLQAGPLMPVSAALALPTRTRAAAPPGIGVLLAAPAAAYQARGPPRA